jgi:hypothetical protein
MEKSVWTRRWAMKVCPRQQAVEVPDVTDAAPPQPAANLGAEPATRPDQTSI